MEINLSKLLPQSYNPYQILKDTEGRKPIMLVRDWIENRKAKKDIVQSLEQSFNRARRGNSTMVVQKIIHDIIFNG
jgi:hypothetical protein